LGLKLGTNEFDALGRMVALWDFCTEKSDSVLTETLITVLSKHEKFAEAICAPEVGLAEHVDGGIRIKGTRGRIEWLAKRRKAARNGGAKTKAKWGAKKEAKSKAKPEPNTEPNDSPNLGSARLGSANLNSSLPVAEDSVGVKVPIPRSEIQEAVIEWGNTLKHFKIDKDPRFDEPAIGQLIKQHGIKKTKLALSGVRFEQKTDTFDPAKHVSIVRLMDHRRFDKFVNLGATQRPRVVDDSPEVAV
jgi:hypothetical protein